MTIAESGVVAFRGHSYLFVTESMSWADANAHAEALGGYLITIGDELEDRFVMDLAEARGSSGVLIGLTDEEEEDREDQELPFEKVKVRIYFPKLQELKNTLIVERWIPWEQVYGASDEDEQSGVF